MNQYIEAIKRGDTVTYGSGDNRKYIVQDDGKGFLTSGIKYTLIIAFLNSSQKTT